MELDYDIACVWLGRALVIYFVLKLLKVFKYLITVHIFQTQIDFSKYGKWSVITGASQGIGKAFAFELASRGQNIILISFDRENLEKVSQEISKKHNVEVKWLCIDFRDDEKIYDEIAKFIKDYDIGVLVNNVGISHPTRIFHEVPDLTVHIRNITKINMLSILKMHQVILPSMVKKRKGIILNMSSGSSIAPMIRMHMYGATKCFINYFSQALSYEYEDKGIIIQSLRPFFLKTEMTKPLPNWKKLPSAEEWIKNALGTIGKEKSTFGDLKNVLKNFVWQNIPVRYIHMVLLNRLKNCKPPEDKKRD